MFEKEAEEYANEYGQDAFTQVNMPQWIEPIRRERKLGFQKGAEFGYNKANEWHYVKDGLPKESGKYLVWVGGVNGVYPLDFETEYNDFGYWCLIINSASLGVTDTTFETITERDEDKVIAWKEIVLPELKENE